MDKAITFGQQIGTIQWYDIDGAVFYQRTLVLGQSVRLAPLFEGMELTQANQQSAFTHLGSRIGEALDIILVPKGLTQGEHVRQLAVPGRESRAADFTASMTHLDLMQVIEDFFGCNLDSSLLARLGACLQGSPLSQPAPSVVTPNGSAPSSPEATRATARPSTA